MEAGEAGCAVWQVEHDDGTRFLKHATGRFVADLRDEHKRLRWCAGRLPVPAVLGFAEDAGEAWLVTTALPGRSVDDVLDEAPDRAVSIARTLGDFLAGLHRLPVEDCPFDATLPVRLAAARANIDAGLVDAEDFDDARAGWTAEQVWAALHALLPLPLERVVTHGDFSLGNVFVEGDAVTGALDVGRLGIADPWQDLAILWNNLEEHGPEAQAAMLSGYGLAAPDPVRLELHLLLDELF